MTLTPVFKSATDTYFNHQAARRAYELVMKMDEDEARALTTMVVADTLWADIDANQRTLQRHLDEVVAKRIERVAKTLDRTYVSKALNALKSDDGQFPERDEVLAYAGAMAVISKAVKTPWDYGYVFDPEHHPRDPETGRFRSKVSYSGAKKPAKGKGGKAAGVPKQYQGRSNKAKAEYQQAHAQLATFMQAFEGGDTDFVVTFQDKQGNRYSQRQQGNRMPDWDPDEEKPIGVEARPNTLTAGGAAFGLVGALGGSNERGVATAQRINATGQALPTFSQDWTGAGAGSQNTNERLYGRVKAGSQFVGQVAPVGSQAQMAAAFGEFVGSHGPQAEKVLGPTTRKAMYRYRGTEKTPDKELAAVLGSATVDLTPEQNRELKVTQNRALGAAQRRKGEQLTSQERALVISRVGNDFRQKNLTPQAAGESQRARARTAALQHLGERIPSRDLYDLQLASGHTPPSEGVIIDAQGKITTQASGYGDDHYLPFNLKNLKGLKGGEYVRTRSVGGPTSEDLYTAMVTGARGFTVTSRSGTFNVEFEDDFRGGRRFNQKASRMVDRYEKLLDAVKSEQVQRQPIPKDVRAQILEQVEDELGPYNASSSQMRAREKELEAEYKAEPYLSKKHEDKLMEQAIKGSNGDLREARVAVAAARNRIMEERSLYYQLNGAGYADALKALREQFPYYLKEPKHEPRIEKERFESERDKGYVKPRHNRPEAAQAGYFDASITGRGKFPASEADYQNAGVRARTQQQAQQATQAGQTAPAAAGGVLRPTGMRGDEAAEAALAIEDQRDFNTAARDVRTVMKKFVNDPSATPDHKKIAEMDDAQLDQYLKSSGNQKTFTDTADLLLSQLAAGGATAGHKQMAEAMTKLDIARAEQSKEVYDPTKHRMNVGKAPYKFGDVKRSAPIELQRKQLDQLASRNPGMDLDLNQYQDDQQYVDALKDLSEARRYSDQFGNKPGAESALQRNLVNERQAKMLAGGTKRVEQALDDTHKARRIRHNIRRTEERGINPGKAKANLAEHQQVQGERKKGLEARKLDAIKALRYVVDSQAASDERKDEATLAITNLREVQSEAEFKQAEETVRRLITPEEA